MLGTIDIFVILERRRHIENMISVVRVNLRIVGKSQSVRNIFGGGGQGNGMMDMMKNATEIKKKADALNKQMQTTTLSETDSTGLVKATVNGMGAPVKYEISPELLKKVSQ